MFKYDNVLKSPKEESIMTGLYAFRNSDVSPSSLSSNIIDNVEEIKSTEKFKLLAYLLKEPLCCIFCRLFIQMTEKTIVYRLKMTYRIKHSSDNRFALFFPVSACITPLTSLKIRINNKNIVGELVCIKNNQNKNLMQIIPIDLYKSTNNFSNNKNKESLMIYSIIPNASQVIDNKINLKEMIDVLVDIQWVSKEMIWNTPHKLQITYPFVCAPRLPDNIICRGIFNSPVVMVQSINYSRGGDILDWKARGNNCKVWIKPKNGSTILKREDKVFDLTFYFKNPFDNDQELSTFGPVVIVLFIGIIIWFLLTKDLEL